MKKISFYTLILTCLGFSACGGNRNNDSDRIDDPIERDIYQDRTDMMDTTRLDSLDTIPPVTPMPTVPMD
ncbi:MAG TPA: hypothetical protein PKA53_11120 [Sphingobacterium sp.]|nr:hypothetical protein [Sphingobacterium sp.]